METPSRNEGIPAVTSALDAFLPEKILENLKEKDDCTADIIEMIAASSLTQLKKLSFIFTGLQNFEMEKIIEITASRVRFQRYNATFLVFSWIKQMFVNTKKASDVEAVYEAVFVPRFRDVDPAIRAICVQFLSDWAVCSKTLRKMSYLKYLGWSLNDRNDSVRRKAIKSIFKISRIITKKDPEDICAFIEKYKGRLLEIATRDANQNIQLEARRSILCIYLKDSNLFTPSDIITVISSDSAPSDIKAQVLKRICPEGIWDLDSLHTLLSQSNPALFINLKLSKEDTNLFILNVIEFIRNRSSCCESNTICFLKILKELKMAVDPAVFMELLNVVKNSASNTQLTVSCLSSICSYSEFPASTYRILDYLFKLASDCPSDGCSFIEEFARLLKKLEDNFSIQVAGIVDSLKDKFPLFFIRHFDISDVLNNSCSPIVKCYGALWKIMKGDYSWVNSMEFRGDLVENGINNLQYLELVDFLVFLIRKIPFDVSTSVDNAHFDAISCAKLLFEKLSAFVSANFLFNDENSCMFLFKLISLGHFTCFSKTLFKYCTEETLRLFIVQSKDVKTLISGYFEHIEDPKNSKFPSLAKLLGSKASKTDSDRFVFFSVKKLIDRTDLLDSALINFIPCLNLSECIVLENLISKSKMKTALLKKCKSTRNIGGNENITFI